MSETLEIQVSSLLFDEENPRLLNPNQGQREVLRALASNQGAKLRVLADDILTNGLDPSELMVVLGVENPEHRFVVLDGNRRLLALKVLENPDLIVGAVSTTVLNALRRSSQAYQQSPIDALPCVVVRDAEEARHWIELKHMENAEGQGPYCGGRKKARASVQGLILQKCISRHLIF